MESSRRAPSPSASSSERCARSSCWGELRRRRDDHRVVVRPSSGRTRRGRFGGRPGVVGAVVGGVAERAKRVCSRLVEGCPGRRSTSGTRGSAAGSGGRQTVVTGRQMTARRGVVTGPSEDPVRGSPRAVGGPSSDGRCGTSRGSRHPSAGSSRRASEGLPGPSWEAFAGAVWRRCGGLMRRPRRIFARARRGSIDGWSRSPAGASRGRYGEVVSAPPDASEVGSIGTSSRVSARAVTGPPSGVAGAV